MGTVNPTQSNPGETIEASDVNTPVNQLAAVVNGNIETVNLADSAVTSAKVADDAITAAKVNFGGSGSGIWWEEIGRVTLSVAGDTMTINPLVAKKYLRVYVSALVTGGVIRALVRFNNDSTNNYANRYSANGAADVTNVSQSAGVTNTTAQQNELVTMDIVNIAAQEKIVRFDTSFQGTAGSSNAPNYSSGVFKWSNTADQITRIDVFNDGAGDYAIGSEVIVLGHD